MAAVPGQLIWEVVKKNNCFLVRQFGRGTASLQFSKEPNNLYNLHSYKHSGLANKKTVTIQSGGKDQSVLLATTKTKKQNKPSALLHKSLMKKEFPRMAKAVKNQVTDNYYRPDLTKAALARLSAVHRSLKVAKSGVKKRNRQALKIDFETTEIWSYFTPFNLPLILRYLLLPSQFYSQLLSPFQDNPAAVKLFKFLLIVKYTIKG
ncbi:hypothetical protein CXB51_012291 [Gossypium anomalum]|uniref:Ribosomal eL28/Mak16 domain-containing protein n=1 Tax=Gossypium anomalum TaxID=47600 RepID=A0A8J6D3R3_9ROSI|nr:hypothetical protein CXB51_012291 [Gossypium anomalum]